MLLLTSELGSGHARAARAVELALLKQAPATVVRTLDFWSLMNTSVAHAVRQTYLRLVQEHPELYERIYRLDERTSRRIIEGDEPPPRELSQGVERITAMFAEGPALAPYVGRYPLDCALLPLLCAAMPSGTRTLPWNGALMRLPLLNWIWARLARRLERRLLAFQPDVVVATQMIPAALLSSVKQRRGIAVPSIGVPTDFGVHDFWIQPGTDFHCVAHESLLETRRPAIAAASIRVTGVPLMPGFARPPTPAQARAELDLDQRRPVVLVLGGGLGLGVAAVAARLQAQLRGAQLLVAVGRNRPARVALTTRAAGNERTLRVVGWTEQMQTFIRAADVVVGKPGGLTVAEVLACGRPLLATRSLGGQEGFNARFLEQQGVGRLVSEDALPACVEAWLATPDELDRLQGRAWAVGRRDGAARIAEMALEFATSTGAAVESVERA